MADSTLPFLHRKAWQQAVKGWHIVGCAIRDRHFVYLVLRKDIPARQASLGWDHDVPSRQLALYLGETDPQEQWGYQDLEGFLLSFAGASSVPVAQGLVVSANGDVYAAGSGQTGMEKVRPAAETISLRRCRTIAGRAMVVGYARGVYRRQSIGHWEPLVNGLPALDVAGMSARRLIRYGFEDIDGFAEDDLYAVGGQGDVWHHDGTRWAPCPFPSTAPLSTVCCAGDGQVYISGEGGCLWQGRGDRWAPVWSHDRSLPYNDSCWFDGALWLSADHGLERWTGSAVEPVLHAGRRVEASGRMAAGDGILVVANTQRAMLFDGANWRTLVAPWR